MPDAAGYSTHDQAGRIRSHPAPDAPVTPTPLRLALQNIRHSAHLASRNTWRSETPGTPEQSEHPACLMHQRRTSLR